jgi:NTE family protein
MALRRKASSTDVPPNDTDHHESVKIEPSVIEALNKRLVVYALQGGGALGAYQVGAYEALLEHELDPDWVTGISIGSLNAAIIAGNEKKNRIPQLKKFWEAITSDQRPWERIMNPFQKITSMFQVGQAVMFGQPNFFRPWIVPAMLGNPGTPQAVSYYTTQPLRDTMTPLVDFGVIARGDVRLTLGSTKIFGGELKFFDNHEMTLRMDHILASGAFPPSFPAVTIDGYGYWDGGVVSNTSVSYLADHIVDEAQEKGDPRDILIICINLWQSYNPEPRTIEEVAWRTKQIQFSSRVEKDMRELHAKVRAKSPGTKVDVLIVGYKSTFEDMPFGDADFSYSSVTRRMDKGRADMRHALEYMSQAAATGVESHVHTI